MFKSLRDKLQKVSDQIEDELETRLEDELEAELAASVEGSPEGDAEAPAEATDIVEEQAASKETAEADAPGSTAGEEPAPPDAPEPSAEEPPETAAEAPSEGREQPSTEVEEPGPSKGTEQRPPEAPETDAYKTPRKGSRKGTQKGPVTGRKVLSDEEIQARLAAEMEDAVEVQKEVEQTVQESAGPRATRYTINEDVLDDVLWELEVALLESDVALPVVEAIKDNVREQLLSMSVGGKNPHEVVEKVLRTAIKRVLSVRPMDFDGFVEEKLAAGEGPVVVMFVGVNGTGKTTSIARIAYRLQQNGRSCVLAAGDTFRAGAIEQLTQHANKLGVKIIKHGAGADPAAVAYDAVDHAKARNKDVVLLDTAGRMQTNTNLMDEMDKIRRVADPALVVFVGDSLAGNDAVEQARRFDEVVDIDGAILTKVDVDAKGGAALSVAYTINKPLLFVGVGQDYPDLRPFEAGWLVDRLFGAEDEAEAEAAA